MVAVATANRLFPHCSHSLQLPNSGLSEVTGIVADTMFKNTVRLRRIVTPVNRKHFLQNNQDLTVFL